MSMHPAADRTLKVGFPTGPSPPVAVKVFPATVRETSSFLRAILDEGFQESTQTRITFPEDDPESFVIFLQLAHRKRVCISRQDLPLVKLDNLASLADKYDMLHLIQPHADDDLVRLTSLLSRLVWNRGCQSHIS